MQYVCIMCIFNANKEGIVMKREELNNVNLNLPPIVGQKTGENKTISCVVFM